MIMFMLSFLSYVLHNSGTQTQEIASTTEDGSFQHNDSIYDNPIKQFDRSSSYRQSPIEFVF